MKKIYHILRGWPSRYNHWSCSKFAHRIQEYFGIDKPTAETLKGWRLWKDRNKIAHPTIYWITEEGFDIVQDILYFPHDVYRNVRNKLHNIFVSKSHFIVTNLPKGEWYDSDTRIVHGLFTLLVDFVEQEKAHMHRICADDDESPIDDNRLAGLTHLDWEISLGDESLNQSKSAQEIKDIYLWIKDVYPNRPDPHDVTGWSEYCENERSGVMGIGEDIDDVERARVKKMLKELSNIENTYEEEDTEMLTRIIKVRKSMWT